MILVKEYIEENYPLLSKNLIFIQKYVSHNPAKVNDSLDVIIDAIELIIDWTHDINHEDINGNTVLYHIC